MTKDTAVTIRVTSELKAAIRKAAHRCEKSQAEFMTKALEKAVVVAGVKAINEQENNNEILG